MVLDASERAVWVEGLVSRGRSARGEPSACLDRHMQVGWEGVMLGKRDMSAKISATLTAKNLEV